MVVYRMRRWYDHWLVMGRWRGSTYPRAMLSIFTAMILNYVYHRFLIQHRKDIMGIATYNEFLISPVGFTLFMQMASFILAFTTGICYNRFWEALGHLYTMSNHLGTAASLAVSTQYLPVPKDSSLNAVRWTSEMLHSISVLHAVCIQTLYTEDTKAPLDILGGVTDWEAMELGAVKDQVALVAHWIHCDLYRRTDLSTTLASQLWTQLANAITAWNNAIKVSKIPLPLSFQQSLAFADLIVLTFTPFCIAAFTYDIYLSLALTFTLALIYHGVYMAAISMQQPFGDKSTDLPLVGVHRDFTRRLLSFITEPIAEELNQFLTIHAVTAFRPIDIEPLISPRDTYGHTLKRKSEPAIRASSPPSSSASNLEASRLTSILATGAQRPPQLTVSREAIAEEEYLSLSRGGSKRGSLLSRPLPNMKVRTEGFYFEGKLLAKEVLLPDKKLDPIDSQTLADRVAESSVASRP